jgi:hypothetical protein
LILNKSDFSITMAKNEGFKVPHGVIMPPESAIIWRYMDFISAIDLFSNRRLNLTRLSLFPDELEYPPFGYVTIKAGEKIIWEKLPINSYFPANSKNKNKMASRPLKELSYANCWSTSENENYALWKIFLKNQPSGIAIKSTKKGLEESIFPSEMELFFGEVAYGNKNKSWNRTGNAFIKSPPYHYENEVRIVFLSDEFIGEDFLSIPVNLNTLCNEIFISPFTNDFERTTIKETLKRIMGREFIESRLRDPSIIERKGK